MKRLLTLLPVLVFCLFCAPAVLAESVPITYLDESGTTQTCDAATVVTANDTAWSDGWYVAQGNVTINNSVTVSGDVNLILEDGASLTVNGSILVEENNRFSVYGQSTVGLIGSLKATASGYDAAIGGTAGNTTGTVNLYGGYITATSTGNGAAIGSGQKGRDGTVHIAGGFVKAVSQSRSAAIGGGEFSDGGTVQISGGSVTATSYDGAAIGAGADMDTPTMSGGTLSISGGTVIATSTGCGPAIGGSGVVHGIGENDRVVLTGGTVIAQTSGAGIAIEGSSLTLSGGTLTVSSANNDAITGTVTAAPAAGMLLTVSAGDSEASASPLAGSPFGTQTDLSSLVKGQRWFRSEAVQSASVEYLDESGTTQTCDAATVVTATGTTWSDGWYVVQGNVTIDDKVTVRGDVKLILENGASLTVNQSILVDDPSTFSIYAQSTDSDTMGSLTANSSGEDASIGSPIHGTGGTVNIYGGKISASGAGYSAAIGGGESSSGFTVNIYGGTVEAISNLAGAAIGGGASGSGVTVNISGGMVEATGNMSGAAIGSGNMGGSVTVHISGGTVEATSNLASAAIGNDSAGSSATVHISGGTVSASNTRSGPAIKGRSITFSGGTVTASSARFAALDGTVTVDPAAGILLTASAGDSDTAASPLEGSPFGTQTDITALVSNLHWFRSEAVTLVTGITLDQTALTLTANDTATLTYTVSPADAAIPALRWTSSNEAVATVNDSTRAAGTVMITARVPGTAVITAEATDGSGVQVQCTVTVEAAPTPTPDSTDSSGSSGSSGSVTPTATPVPDTQAPTDYYTCPACGTHNWTATDGGYRCDNCGYLETARQLSGYGNVKGVYTPAAQSGATGSNTAAASIPQTGDESHPALWLVLLAASALGLGGLAIARRKFPL